MDLVRGPDGLIPVIVQDRLTGQVRLLAHMNEEALAATARTGMATFFSRSRQALWIKGETSGNGIRVREIVADCDADALLLLADPLGPTCHTGSPSCFFRAVSPTGAAGDDGGGASARDAAPFLVTLEREIAARKTGDAARSYTKSLLDGGPEMIGAKLREEANELARAIAGESEERVASEAADVIYHLMVGLASRGVSLRDVVGALAARAGVSGHAEKAGR
jgi:phosphoribosyl-ATP pyrophosphohydrolase/phosphoribosyl-AMP cyclohydrolase